MYSVIGLALALWVTYNGCEWGSFVNTETLFQLVMLQPQDVTNRPILRYHDFRVGIKAYFYSLSVKLYLTLGFTIKQCHKPLKLVYKNI